MTLYCFSRSVDLILLLRRATSYYVETAVTDSRECAAVGVKTCADDFRPTVFAYFHGYCVHDI